MILIYKKNVKSNSDEVKLNKIEGKLDKSKLKSNEIQENSDNLNQQNAEETETEAAEKTTVEQSTNEKKSSTEENINQKQDDANQKLEFNNVLRSADQNNILNLEDGSKISFDKTDFDGKLNDQINSTFISSSFNAGDIYEILLPKQFVSDVIYSGLPAGLGTTSKSTEQINGTNYIKITNSFINNGTVNQSFAFERAIVDFTGEKLYPGQVLGSDIIVRKNGSNIGTITLGYVIPDTLQGTTKGSDTKYGADVNEPKYNNTNYDFAVSFKPLLKNMNDNSNEGVTADLNLLNRTVENIQISISVPEYFKVDTSKDVYVGSQDINLGKPQQEGVGKNVIINIPVDKISEFSFVKSNNALEFPVVFSGMMQVPDEIVNNATTPLEFNSPEKSIIEFTFNDGSKQRLPEFNFASVRVNNLPFDNASGDSLSVKSQKSLNFVGGDYADKVTSDPTKYGVFTGTFNVKNIKDSDVSDIEFVYELPDGLGLNSKTIDITSTSNIELYDIVSEYWDGSTGNTLETTNNGSQLKKVSFKVRNMTPGQNIHITPGFYDIASKYHNGLSVAGGDTLITKLTVNGSVFNQVSTIIAVADKKPFIDQGGFNLPGDGPFAPLGDATGVNFNWQANDNTNDYDFNLVGPTVLISVPDTLFFTKTLTPSDFLVTVDNKGVSSDLYTVETIDIDGNKLFKLKLDDSVVAKKSLFVSLYDTPKVVADATTGSDHYYGFLISNSDYSQNNDSHGTITFIGTDQSKMDDYQKEIVNNLINQGYNAGSIVTGTPTTFNILISEGTTAIDLTKGNLNVNVSNDSTNDVFVGDEFEITHSIVNSSSTTINNLYSFVNVPGTYDGSSQFDVQLTGPIKLINVGTGDDVSSNATIVYSTNPVNIDKNNRPTLDGFVNASEVNDWSQIKSYAIVWNKFEGDQSIRAIANVKDVHSYDNVGKSVKTSSLTYANNLETFVIKASDVASAKTTIVGSVVLHTQIKWVDESGQEHVIKIPLDKKYDLTKNNTLNKSDFLTEHSQEYIAVLDQIPENYRVDFDNPTIENSNEIYRDGYPNNVAEFDKPVNYSANNDVVTYTLVPKTEQVSESKEITRTIHYVDENGKTLADENVQTLTFTRNGTKNLVTNEITWDEWSPEQSFDPIDSPEITNYTPDKELVSSINVTAKSNDIDETVVYTPNKEEVEEDRTVANIIRYVDYKGNQVFDPVNQGLTFTRTGERNMVTGEIVWNDWSPEQTFDKVVSPELKGYTPNIKIVENITVNHDSDNQGTVVEYEPNIQKLIVNYIDKTTGKTLSSVSKEGFTDESSDYSTVSAISAYQKQGYNLVSDETNGLNLIFDNDDDTDQVYNVYLQHNTESVSETKDVTRTIHYVAKSDPTKTLAPDSVQTLTFTRTGTKDLVTGEIDWTEWSSEQTFDQIDSPKIANYTPDKEMVESINVNANSNNIEETIVYTPNKEQVSESKVVTNTIRYVNYKAEQVFDTVIQELTFTRTGERNMVSGEITWSDWSPEQTFDKVISPELKGYTPDIEVVENITANHDSNNQGTVVEYIPNIQKLTVNYIDKTTGKTLNSVSKDGTTNENSGYSTLKDVAKYQKQGYKLFSDETNGENLIFDDDDNVDQIYNVYLDHDTENVSENKSVNRTIHYIDQDGNQVASDYVYSPAEFNRTGIKDKVTNETTWNEWSKPESFESVKSPDLDGYTPDKLVVDEFVPNVNEPFTEATVTYSQNEQIAKITIIDVTEDKELNSLTTNGKFGEKIEFTDLQKLLDEYVSNGYVIKSNNFDNQTFNSDNSKNEFVIKLVHSEEPVAENKVITRTINYVDNEGNKLKDPVVQKVELTRTGTKDKVTGKVIWNDWDKSSFDLVKSPEIDGYNKPSIDEVSQSEVNGLTENSEINVVYTEKEKPVEPEQPTKPELPKFLEKPVDPELPTTPKQPVEPEMPELPVDPNSGQLIENEQSKSTSDVEPLVEPEKSVKYEHSNETKILVKSTKSESSNQNSLTKVNNKELPQMGNSNEQNAKLLGFSLLASLIGLFGINLGKKKRKEN